MKKKEIIETYFEESTFMISKKKLLSRFNISNGYLLKVLRQLRKENKIAVIKGSIRYYIGIKK